LGKKKTTPKITCVTRLTAQAFPKLHAGEMKYGIPQSVCRAESPLNDQPHEAQQQLNGKKNPAEEKSPGRRTHQNHDCHVTTKESCPEGRKPAGGE